MDLDQIKEAVKVSVQNFEQAKDDLEKTHDYAEYVNEKLNRAIWDGNFIINSLDTLGGNPNIFNDDLFVEPHQFLNSGISGMIEHSQDFIKKAQDISNNYKYLSGAISQSDVNMGTGAVAIHTFYREYEEIYPGIAFNIGNPYDNPYRKKEFLINKLKIINPILEERLNSISSSIGFQNKIRDLKNNAHLMREFISEFIQLCDPGNNVKNMDWCEFSDRKNPKQKSRVIYAIIGNNSKFDSNDPSNKPIVEIAKNYRKLYQNLNGIAHNRSKKITSHIRMRLNIYFNQLIEYTETIISLREKFST